MVCHHSIVLLTYKVQYFSHSSLDALLGFPDRLVSAVGQWLIAECLIRLLMIKHYASISGFKSEPLQIPMKAPFHSKPPPRPLESIPGFALRLAIIKVTRFLLLIVVFLLAGHLQSRGFLSGFGVWACVILEVCILGALLFWDWTLKRICPGCNQRMRKALLKSSSSRGDLMILSCKPCNTYVDLGASID